MITSVMGCKNTAQSPNEDETPAPPQKGTIVFAWYPNESGGDLEAARNEIAQVIEEATGKKVKHRTTTDYLIAIEAVVNGNADVAFTGAEGYIQAHNKNAKVLPLMVNSGNSGTLEDAVYYSWLIVKKENEEQYLDGGQFSLDNIAGKKFSFVSNSSTSGFRVPSAGIVSYFSKTDKWKNIKTDDLLEGGLFFSEVLFGGSHQGSGFNVLSDKADIGAVCDTCVYNYIEHVSGTHNRAGAVYKIRDDAAEPFNTLIGEEFVVISSTPVLNAPFIYNSETISVEDIDSILAAMTSDKVAQNEKIFVPKESDFKGMFQQGHRFVQVNDAWFNPIRELSGK
jgi:phosphonate transport system substrate-binding protein